MSYFDGNLVPMGRRYFVIGTFLELLIVQDYNVEQHYVTAGW